MPNYWNQTFEPLNPDNRESLGDTERGRLVVKSRLRTLMPGHASMEYGHDPEVYPLSMSSWGRWYTREELTNMMLSDTSNGTPDPFIDWITLMHNSSTPLNITKTIFFIGCGLYPSRVPIACVCVDPMVNTAPWDYTLGAKRPMHGGVTYLFSDVLQYQPTREHVDAMLRYTRNLISMSVLQNSCVAVQLTGSGRISRTKVHKSFRVNGFRKLQEVAENCFIYCLDNAERI